MTHVLIFRCSSHRRLLEFCFNSKSVKPCVVNAFDVPAFKLEPNGVELEGGNSLFLCICGPNLIFDTRTRIFYEFPKFFFALVCADQCNYQIACDLTL